MNPREALDAHQAAVEAKYASVRQRHLDGLAREAGFVDAAQQATYDRQGWWLLIDDQGRIHGVTSRVDCPTESNAFEQFFPRRKDRLSAADSGWHVEPDDEQGGRFAAWAKELQSPQETDDSLCDNQTKVGAQDSAPDPTTVTTSEAGIS